MAKDHPAGYALLPDSASLARAYWGLIRDFGETYGSQIPTKSAVIGTDGDVDERISCQEIISLKGLVLLRACMKMVFNPVQTFRYQRPEDKEENKLAKEFMKKCVVLAPSSKLWSYNEIRRYFY